MMHIRAHAYSLCMLHAYTSQLHVSMYIISIESDHILTCIAHTGIVVHM